MKRTTTSTSGSGAFPPTDETSDYFCAMHSVDAAWPVDERLYQLEEWENPDTSHHTP